MRQRVIQVLSVTVAVALGAWLWMWSGDDDAGRGVQGGPLFEFTGDEVVSLEIRRPDGVSTLERRGEGWTLTGLVTDLVDPERLEPVLAQIVGGHGDPVIAGTEPDERRYGFGGDDSLELVFHLADGQRRRLALGDANPVTERVYASGAGRSAVFAVGGGLYAAAARLPDSVRLPRLLPELSLADLDSLHVARRGDDALPFARLDDGRWWLRPPGGLESLVGKASLYHERYQDRRRDDHGAAWVLADVRRLRNLVFRATDTDVVAFPVPGQDSPAALAEAGLAPPYRGTVLFARGAETWRLDFGEEQVDERSFVPVLRRGTLVVTRGEALHPLEGPLSGFLDLGALSFRTEDADSLWIDEPNRPLLWGTKAADQQARRRERQSVWDAVIPPGWNLTFGPETTANHLADIQTHLDRLECLEVMHPVMGSPLLPEQRWRVRAAYAGGRLAEVWLGRLATDGRAAAWDPSDGKVVTVPEEILLTLRNLRGDLRAE